MKTTKDNRAILLDMAAGGDGNTDSWIERVVYEATPTDAEAEAYLLHVRPKNLPNGGRTAGAEYCGTLEQCRTLYIIFHDDEFVAAGLLPAGQRTAAQVEAAEAQIPYKDTGRRVPPGRQQKRSSMKLYY